MEQIRDLAVRFGNRIELTEGWGVYDTILVIGDNREFAARIDFIRGLPGVQAVLQTSAGYNNIARVVRSKDGKAVQRERRIVEVRGLDGLVRRFGAGQHMFICGPDSPQTLDQTLTIARQAKALGEKFGILDRVMLRGGAFKPRTRPTDWRGLGMKGIAMLDAAREETGLPYVTEVMDHNLVEQIGTHADMLQIGTRNAQNFDLLEAAGRFGKPVILKRGFGNEVEEWFYSAEYIANQGNLDILLCERGMKTLFTKGGYCRNQPDLNACSHARKHTILPVLFDPSHVSGDHRIVSENLLAACGHLIDGSITETIHTEAFRRDQLCDASQALVMDTYSRLVEAILAFETHVQPHMLAINGDTGAL